MTRDRSYAGLTTEQALRSREEHGANIYKQAKKKTFFSYLLQNLKDPIIRILIAAMTVNVLFTIKNINWAENIGMIAAIIISSVVSSLSERGSEKAFEKLREEEKKVKTEVLRDGKVTLLCSEELVVGDLLILHAGTRVPADAELIEGTLRIDESPINGEAHPAKKSAKNSKERAIFAGCMILEGEGSAVVKSVGDASLYGQIAKEIQNESEESPLKKRLSKLARTISKIGYAAAAIVALTYLYSAFISDAGYDKAQIMSRLTDLRFLASHLIKAITIAMTVIVVAVPEGLPMMISVVLSSNMKKMTKDNVLVRKPVGIETAGCINILFTDKTGTLTKGVPECKEVVFGNGERYRGREALDERTAMLLDCCLHMNSSVRTVGDELVGGNGTEQALYAFTKPVIKGEIIEKIPFDSERKYSMCRVKIETTEYTFIKGAPEKIVKRCGSCAVKGEKTPFDQKKMSELTARLSRAGNRILALAYTQSSDQSEELPQNMTFLCIAVLADGLRPSASGAVKDLQDAGIHTVMITGDSKETASKIAKECGILSKNATIVIEGSELAEKTDVWIKENISKLAVVARALPSDKNRLIKLSREKGLIVGMTGDGINDAPALKNADVGFAMGSGSEIAKEAGDIIILDNDLSSIVKAVLYGRTIFKSIRKFITFQLIMNICAVGVTLIGQTLGVDHPVTVIQMLWVNMIMDTLGGLAFAGEQPMKFYLKEAPISREEPILTKKMLTQIVIMGVYGMALSGWFLGSRIIRGIFLYSVDQTPMLTAFFALFIFTGVTICFTARSERVNILKGLLANKAFTVIMALILCIQMFMLYFGGKTFRCVGLSGQALMLVSTAALTVLPVDLIRRLAGKLFKRKRQRQN